jgi:transcription antitermination factor NusG
MVSRWFLINTKPRKEFQVENILSINLDEVEVYCPKYMKKNNIRAFFPNYLFIKIADEKLFYTIKYTPGVRKIIGNGKGPVIVPEEIIKAIKEREEEGYVKIVRKNDDLRRGDKVKIEEGPFDGVEGIFQEELKDSERVKILVSLLLVETKKEYINKVK